MRYTLAQIKDGTGFAKGQEFEPVERYDGYANHETWAVALWINNDQGWQESVHESLRGVLTAEMFEPSDEPTISARRAGEIIRENVERQACYDFSSHDENFPASLSSDLVQHALERVDWDELGATFLTDLAEIDSYDAEQED